MTEPRNWDKELADVDRAIAKQPPASTPAPAGRPVPTAQRRFVALTWFWTSVAVVMAVALAVWPYDRNCGIRLIFFLGAGGIALMAGVLGALAAWANRRGLAHVLSLLVIVWAGVMVLREILPRAGYAKESRDWTCPQTPPAPAPAPSPQPPTQ
ncbi:MAG TPA: hypothetical protein VGN76_14730 [Gemmatimonadales bacterium]|jgi:hypothetical protein|nr:hypothetical protein [Gemmatimonadales bacterium]